MKVWSIYKITGPSGSYVGQTYKSLEQRFREHCRKQSGCLYLKHAILKYGREQFTIELLTTANTRDDALRIEREMILEHRTLVQDGGYNIILSGAIGNLRIHCKQGHVLDEVGRTTNGSCRICSNQRTYEFLRKKKLANPTAFREEANIRNAKRRAARTPEEIEADAEYERVYRKQNAEELSAYEKERDQRPKRKEQKAAASRKYNAKLPKKRPVLSAEEKLARKKAASKKAKDKHQAKKRLEKLAHAWSENT